MAKDYITQRQVNPVITLNTKSVVVVLGLLHHLRPRPPVVILTHIPDNRLQQQICLVWALLLCLIFGIFITKDSYRTVNMSENKVLRELVIGERMVPLITIFPAQNHHQYRIGLLSIRVL